MSDGADTLLFLIIASIFRFIIFQQELVCTMNCAKSKNTYTSALQDTRIVFSISILVCAAVLDDCNLPQKQTLLCMRYLQFSEVFYQVFIDVLNSHTQRRGEKLAIVVKAALDPTEAP